MSPLFFIMSIKAAGYGIINKTTMKKRRFYESNLSEKSTGNG
jgi:hypothetical protein